MYTGLDMCTWKRLSIICDEASLNSDFIEDVSVVVFRLLQDV